LSPTQQQLAKELGLSVFSISHALRGTDQVSAATRRRVMKTAAKMGYRLNTSARSTATGRFGAVAFVRSVVAARSWYPEPLIDGIEDALEADGMRLTMARIADEQLTDPGKLPAVLREHCVDGLLINYISRTPDALGELLDRLALPHAWINVDRDHDCVRFDDAAAARMAVRKLIEAGHRRIGYLHYRSNPNGAHYSAHLRLHAYTAAMVDAGLKPQVLTDAHHLPVGEMPAITERHLQSPDRPTALITYGSPEASVVLLAAARLGIRVPRDLSLVSIGSTASLMWSEPVSHADLSEAEVGRAAVEMLTRKIAQPTEQLPVHLVKPVWNAGQSVCPPPASGSV
jgi:LacI family transcriptional regulator